MALLVVIATGITFAAVYLYQFFSHPLARAEGGANLEFSWSGRRPVNFALLTNSSDSSEFTTVSILHLDPEAGRAVLLPISTDVLSNIFRVDSAVTALAKELAIPIRGYFLVSESGSDRIIRTLGSASDWRTWDWDLLFKTPALIGSLRGELRTNLSLDELWRLTRFILALRADQRITAGGYPEFVDLGADESVRFAGEGILVLNGTTLDGLASRAALWIKNLGGNIIDSANAPERNFSSSVILADDINSYTVQALAQTLGILDLRSKGGNLRWEKRANIVVIVGLDKAESF